MNIELIRSSFFEYVLFQIELIHKIQYLFVSFVEFDISFVSLRMMYIKIFHYYILYVIRDFVVYKFFINSKNCFQSFQCRRELSVWLVVCIVNSHRVLQIRVEIVQCDFHDYYVSRVNFINDFRDVDTFVDKKTYTRFSIFAIRIIRIIKIVYLWNWIVNRWLINIILLFLNRYNIMFQYFRVF